MTSKIPQCVFITNTIFPSIFQPCVLDTGPKDVENQLYPYFLAREWALYTYTHTHPHESSSQSDTMPCFQSEQARTPVESLEPLDLHWEAHELSSCLGKRHRTVFTYPKGYKPKMLRIFVLRDLHLVQPVRPYLGCLHPILECLGSSPRYTPDSSFLQMQTPGRGRRWLHKLCPSNAHQRTGQLPSSSMA